ncbi:MULTISPECIES: hypothetical protein [unclassified Rhodococcus (in: high G+C Gram-positive bacteria)]|uniref:hypothetical protein n=1 Tax=unclassified Rhodococcus (in: high G+C Gram-positive bacteria) TaxID=192944 RepID=UPI000928433D|nr:hypothetical protein [Rhodococcus sp. M8]OLL18415.1 hypothetical protein BKE56_018055 [Rhodococcus sp. M8]QPG45473.1 hypothetical protein ISO16_27390 [Rhodococcus sp. M8]
MTASALTDAKLVRALSDEFLSRRVDYNALERLHHGDVADWAATASRFAALSDEEERHLALRWRDNPRELLDILLARADEVTARRCRTAWVSLDRFAPFVRASNGP